MSYRSREDDDYRRDSGAGHAAPDSSHGAEEGDRRVKGLYNTYQECKQRFDQAEKDFSDANEDYEHARQVKLSKQDILRNAKHSMDQAYQHWTTGEAARATTSSDNNDSVPPGVPDLRYRDDNDRKRKSYDGYNNDEQYRRDRRPSRASYGGDRQGRSNHYQDMDRSNNSGQNRSHYQPQQQDNDGEMDRSSPSGHRSNSHYQPQQQGTRTPPASAAATTTSSAGTTDPSIFIPFVHTNITKERISDAIERQGYGRVSHVDLVALTPRPGKPPINRAYVHLTWEDEVKRQEYLRVRPGGHVPLVYEEPWFWKTMPNKPPAAQRANANNN